MRKQNLKMKTIEKHVEGLGKFLVETDEEKRVRLRKIVLEQRAKARREQDEKCQKMVFKKPILDTLNMTIEQEDYWYRKEMREAMEEDADIFSYHW
jgi:hypothetical protein